MEALFKPESLLAAWTETASLSPTVYVGSLIYPNSVVVVVEEKQCLTCTKREKTKGEDLSSKVLSFSRQRYEGKATPSRLLAVKVKQRHLVDDSANAVKKDGTVPDILSQQ